MRAVKILTWSSSSFHLAAALFHHTKLIPVPFRCMRAVSDLDVLVGPAKPSDTQPSAWHAHPSIRKVIMSLWGLVAAYAGWATLAIDHFSNAVIYGMPLSGNGPWWILCLANVAGFQGPLTFGLHCSELIVDVIRDERHWRCASGTKGLKVSDEPVEFIALSFWSMFLNDIMYDIDWMFGLAFKSQTGTYAQTLGVAFYMHTIQIWNLCIALFVFACFFTLVSLRQPHGPQPAAYGHLQTLANLVDEWSPVMWWGHKEDEIPYCHAGRVFV
ncbi:uncharacterized protein BJ212DRAFT_1264057 [Suillus subaureus]|uniref:Uncharacterized protein n=1 Tax=Suillus subaureus TaxID=48587 RepID=A0A9P7JHL2_9AGAM|nr:uncharacterized protein BJ212DRAFT_1264057 [Suillus subaureus]KAG1822942.1 hypothetical protein BJ212DRAFT_1264057 [Suillus subaureus]